MMRLWDVVAQGIAGLFVLSFLLPVLARNFGSKLSWVLFALWVPIALLMLRRTKRNVTGIIRGSGWMLGLLTIWTVVVAIRATFSVQDSGRVHLIAAIGTWMAVLMGVVHSRDGPYALRPMLVWQILLLGLQALVSLPVLVNEIGVAKDLMMVDASKSAADYGLRGVGDYNLYTSLAVLSPAMLGAIVSLSWRYGLVPGACFGAILGSIALATFSGAAAITGIGVIVFLSLMGSRQGGRKWVFIAAVAIGVLVLLEISVADLNEAPQIALLRSKLEGLFKGVLTDGVVEGDTTGRGRLAMLSLNSFLQHPFFGVGPVTMSQTNEALYVLVGGHSSWLDQLAEYGLVGFSPFLAFLVLAFRNKIREFRTTGSSVDAGFVAMMVSYFICGLVNPVVFVDSITVPFAFLAAGIGAKTKTSARLMGTGWNAGCLVSAPIQVEYHR